ncbi:MAG: hypothetical protein WA384_16830, partial [Rhodomicrobium sp.]
AGDAGQSISGKFAGLNNGPLEILVLTAKTSARRLVRSVRARAPGISCLFHCGFFRLGIYFLHFPGFFSRIFLIRCFFFSI